MHYVVEPRHIAEVPSYSKKPVASSQIFSVLSEALPVPVKEGEGDAKMHMTGTESGTEETLA
jgi:hypothetical protein